ncbi:hypothetical protein MSAN_02333100 [Mycena sanguinolenta]|uniref:Uncharacterized protein n=1 Tax=Mycena sanguinolenta TaxID=230812 RepID=A0A8H6X6V2_9AGAR|nr:hypothetical protein MSAN_02333100 [Mycena sanguinolenta]
MFQKLCGEHAFGNVAIVTSRWDLEERAVAESRFAQLQAPSQPFKSVLNGGAKIYKHDGSSESARKVLRDLVCKTPNPLLIQREMAEEHKQVSETAAGQELQREILKQVEKHEREMSKLLEEMTQSPDASALKELEEECQALREQIVHWQDEGKKLTGISSSDEREAEEFSRELSSFNPSSVAHPSLAHPLVEAKEFDDPNVSIKTEIAEIKRMLDEELQRSKENEVRIENMERRVAGVVRLPCFLVAILDRLLTLFGHHAFSTR